MRLFGMVNSTPDFADHPKVIDGASDLILNCSARSWSSCAFCGRHGELPRGQAVEINGEFELLAEA